MKIEVRQSSSFHFSPLRYPGGKTSLYPFFERVIRENRLQDLTYVEPFAGGAGAALALLLSNKIEKIVINDLDRAIFSFWKSAVYESERFIRKIHNVPITVPQWKLQKKVFDSANASEFDLGFATFFLNRTNVSGILEGGPIGGLDQSGKYKINARFNKTMLISRIRDIAARRDDISVFNEDGLSLIRRFLNQENTFIYLDPPYYDKGASLYMNHYVKENHEALAKELNRHPDAYWLLTYDNKKEIRSLYPKRNIQAFTLHYNAYESREGKEILIRSDAFNTSKVH